MGRKDFDRMLTAFLAAAPPTKFDNSLEVFGIKFVGVNPENGQKVMLTFAAIAVFLLLRRVLRALEEAKIGIASSTYDIVGLPPLRLVSEPPVTHGQA